MAETTPPAPTAAPAALTPPSAPATFTPAPAPQPPKEQRFPWQYKDEPWLTRDEKGNWVGQGSYLPENVPGSPEYEVTKTDRLREENAWLFDRAKNVGFYNEDASQAIFGLPASALASDSAGRQRQIEDAAWGVLKVKRPEADWNSRQIINKLVPYATTIRDADILKGIKFPSAYGMEDSQLEAFVMDPNFNISPDVAAEILKELSSPGYAEQKRAIGTSLVSNIRKSLALIDPQMAIGKTVSEQGPDYLNGLNPQERREAFEAMARYRGSQKTNILGDGFAAGSVFIQDGFEALAGFVDGVNPFTNPDEYLSEKYRADPKLRAKAEQVMVRATSALNKPISRLREVQRLGNPEAFMTTLDHYTDANEPSNQEFLSSVAELQALREDGAFAPGMKGEKLASFGSGVLQSVVNFKHFVSDSTDPNAYLFLRKAKAVSEGNIVPWFSAIPAAFTDNYWDSRTPHFSRDRDYEIDKAIQVWSENFRNVTGAKDNIMSRAYASLGMDDLARFAKTAYGDERLAEQSSMIYDPLTLVAGGVGLIGKAAGITGKVTMAAELSARGRTLTAEGMRIIKRLDANKALSAIDKADFANIIDDVSKATGRTLTESEAMLIALSGSGADMLSDAGLASASNIKKIIGKSALPEALIAEVAEYSAKTLRFSNEVKKAMPGTTGPKRLLTGYLAAGTGAIIETIPGKGLRKVGEFMAQGGSERALGRSFINRLLSLQPRQVVTGAALVGGGTWAGINIASGDEWYSGAGLAFFGTAAALKPQYLIAAGGKIENWAKVERRIARAAISGERVSGSPIQAALNAARTELGKTTDTLARAGIESEMKTLNWMVESGYEKALQTGFHVTVDNLVHGGTIGLTMAWANDQAAAGSGFGIGAAASTAMAGLNRVTQTANRFLSTGATRSKEVIANVSGILNDVTPEQAARVRSWLNGSKDVVEFIERADSFRRAYDATGGKVVASTPAEIEVVKRGVNLDASQLEQIRRDASREHPKDATAAALYAEERIAALDENRRNQATADELNGKLIEVNRRADSTLGLIDTLKGKIAAEEALLAKAGKQSSVALERLRNDLNNEEVKLKVYLAEHAQLDAQAVEANRKVTAPVAFRPGETRVNSSGSEVTMVREGMYIETGAQRGTIHFDISRADAFTMNHESWEALLNDNAVRSVVPQLTKVLWNSPSEGGRISAQARTAFFDAYASSLNMEQGKLYREQLKVAQKEYEANGTSPGLERYTREAMAWWMATIDGTRPVGYGGIGPSGKLVNVRGEGLFDSLRRITVGERSLYDVLNTDNLRREFSSMFDPQLGLFPRQYSASMAQSLRESGMRFIKQSDGTVRGFWLNNRGEIVRDPVVNRLYESIYRMTNGGKGSRLAELNMNSLTHEQQAQVLTQSGLSWLVDPDTQTPIQGIDTPVAQPAQPTPTAGQPTQPTPTGAGQPVIPTYNGQPIQPGVNPPPRPTPAPSPTPAPTGQAAPAPTAGGKPTPPPVTPTPFTPPPVTPTPVQPTPVQPTPSAPTTPPAPTARPPVNPSTLPPLGVVVGAHSQIVLDTLTNIPQNQRGLTWSVDTSSRGNKTVIWGVPTAAEINAIANAQGLPDVVRNNVLLMAQTMAQGGERPIFRASYANVFSRNLSATNESRAFIGKNGFQFVSERTFVPLYFETTTQYWDTQDPKRVISEAQFDKLSPAKKGQYTPRASLNAKVFDIDAFHDNKNLIFSDGIRVYGEGSSFTYLKDINGNELNPAYIRELFRDDTEFFTLANDWLNHYNQGSPIDPTTLQATKGEIVEPSALRLGNGDRVLGEARLTVLRAAYGMTTRQGRVVVNPTTFTDQATRGLAFPFTNMNVSTIGTMVDTGARSLISQTATTRGQFNMSPAAWSPRLASITDSMRQNMAKVNPNSTLTNAYVHLNMQNTYINEFNGRTFDIYVDGENVPNQAKTLGEAQKVAQEAILKAQEMMDARAFGERVLREEAAREAKEQASVEDKRKKTEAQRTRAEADLIKEVKKNDADWLAQADKLAKLEAEVIAKAEKEKLRIEKERQQYEAQFQRLLDQEAKNKERQDKKAQEAEQRRIDAEKKRYEAEFQRLLREEEKANAQKAIEEQRKQQEEIQRQFEELRRDIEERSAQAAEVQENQQAFADALRSNTTELDVGETLRRSLRVDPYSLPVAGENRLIVRRVAKSKPFVTQTLTAKQQAGPAVDLAQGNIRVARALGSEEARAAVPSLNKYIEETNTAKDVVISAINDVWKTEMGNQLHAVYTGLDALGKPKYIYHLYGINGQELYRTTDAVALYRNMLVNEQRLRGQTKAQAPKTQEKATDLQTEILRQMRPEAYLQSQKTTMQRKAESETANRYK
jgi:hypothetical protein